MLDELFAEAPAAISLLMRSTVSSVQAVSHIWKRCLFRPNFAHVSWESDFRRFYNQTNLRRDKRSEIVFAFCFDPWAACSGDDIWTRNEVSRVFFQSRQKKNWLCVTVIIPDNFFSLWQSKNYHKAFLKVFRKKGTILRTFKTFLTFPLVTRQVERYHLENVAACSV